MAYSKGSKIAKEPIKLLSGNDAATKLKKYVEGRRDGTIKSVRTKFNKLNDAIMGGFEWNTILAVAALSGFGKSLLEKEVIASACALNTDIEVLRFNFEMEASQQVAREIMADLGYDIKTLYSVGDAENDFHKPMSEEEYNIFLSVLDKYKESSANTHFEEIPIDYDDIRNVIIQHWNEYCKDEGKGLIVSIDHALITQGREGDSEKEIIDQLMKNLNLVKKSIANQGGRIFIIVLSQLNREIKSKERLFGEPEGHYPMTSDLFGASSIEQYSNYIIIQHIPTRINIKVYTDKKLPTRIRYITNDKKEEVEIIYWHLLKNRMGSIGQIFPIWPKFSKFSLVEIPKDKFEILCKQFWDNLKKGLDPDKAIPEISK